MISRAAAMEATPWETSIENDVVAPDAFETTTATGGEGRGNGNHKERAATVKFQSNVMMGG